MAPRYVSKHIRGNWAESDMKSAIAAVKSGAMKVLSAAKHYKVPRRTLRRYIIEKKENKSKLGRKPLLSNQEEKELASRIIRLSDVGYPLTKRVLRMCVQKYCLGKNMVQARQNVLIGRDWMRGFMKRHDRIRKRKAQNLNPARAQKLNKAVVSDYFTKLKKLLEDNELMHKPERIYNIDEKGCQLKLHKTPEVLAECGAKRVHLVAPEHAENVTVVSCGSAVGYAIPPMLLFKGKRMKPEWLDSLPTGAVAQMTQKGSMTVSAFVNWIHHFAKYKLPGPCVLLFDGAKCHLDDSIIDVADKYDIKLFCLPSNTTHELQPMDKSVFRAFEYYWDEEVLKYWSQHQDRRITKQRFGAIFSRVWDKALTPANIKAGFEATGIYPFDPMRIPEEAYAPSIPTYRPPPVATAQSSQQEGITQQTDNLSPALDAASTNDESVVNNPLPIPMNVPLEQNDDIYTSEDDIPLANLRPTIDTPNDSTNMDTENVNTSIHDLLPTPEKITTPSSTRRKAINSLALELTNRTFVTQNIPGPSYTNQIIREATNTPELITRNNPRRQTRMNFNPEVSMNNPAPGPSKPNNPKTHEKKKVVGNKGKGRNKVKNTQESWYCFVCDEDKVADMRLCIKCASYVHEECVGLTSNDKENFICMKCE